MKLPKSRVHYVPRKSILGILEIIGSVFLSVPGEMSAEICPGSTVPAGRSFSSRTSHASGNES